MNGSLAILTLHHPITGVTSDLDKSTIAPQEAAVIEAKSEITGKPTRVFLTMSEATKEATNKKLREEKIPFLKFLIAANKRYSAGELQPVMENGQPLTNDGKVVIEVSDELANQLIQDVLAYRTEKRARHETKPEKEPQSRLFGRNRSSRPKPTNNKKYDVLAEGQRALAKFANDLEGHKKGLPKSNFRQFDLSVENFRGELFDASFGNSMVKVDLGALRDKIVTEHEGMKKFAADQVLADIQNLMNDPAIDDTRRKRVEEEIAKAVESSDPVKALYGLRRNLREAGIRYTAQRSGVSQDRLRNDRDTRNRAKRR